MRLRWQLLWTLVAAAEGAAVCLVAAVLLEVGAEACHDVRVGVAACAPPMSGSWALWAAPLLGGLAGLLVARRALSRCSR